MGDLNFLSKLSGGLQIAIVIFGLLTSSLAYFKWRIDKQIGSIKDKEYSQKLAVLSPRKLTIEQKNALISRLSSLKDHSVALASRMLDGESSDFADEIASVFKQSGIKVGLTNRSSLSDLPGYLTIAVTGDGLNGDADLISQALNDAGILCKFENIKDGSISGLLPNTVYVIVGRKH